MNEKSLETNLVGLNLNLAMVNMYYETVEVV
jgi:hypothetical protein